MVRKTCKPSEKGMFDRTQAPPAELEDLFSGNVAKFNQCHGAQGKFCSGASGGGGKGGGGAAPAPDKQAQADEAKRKLEELRASRGVKPTGLSAPKREGQPPRDIPGFNKNATFKGPRGAGMSNFPNVKEDRDARKELRSLVGKQVDVEYTVSHQGRNPRGEPTLCVQNVKIAGTKITLDHLWIPKPDAEQLTLKRGAIQQATGRVGEYLKNGGETKNYEVGSLTNTVTIKKFNQCHGPQGKFCSGATGGGGGGGGASFANEEDKAPVIVGDVVMAPQSSMAPLQDKKFKKPENLTDDEYKALRMYGGTDYAVLNSYLRNKPDDMTDKYKWMTQSIDSAMSKQDPLKGQMKVYRGSEYSRLFGKKKPEEIIGAKITDKGFMSTSASSEVAERFGSARFTITLPPGMKALDMIKNTGTVAAKSEREWLLPRNTQIEITHVTQTKGGLFGMGKKTYIEAKVVPVEKAMLEKYNQCHGAGGKFCSGTSGGGGGGFQNTSGELTPAEQSAVDSYANTGFKAMNNALRGKEPMTPDIEQQVSHIDSAMAKNPLTKNETVFRGIKSTKFLNGETDPAKIKGMTIVDKGFMSTSANSETAAGFSVGKGGVNMTIHVPKGLKALDIRNHIFTDQAFEEHEILLPRNTKLKITRAEQQGSQLRLTAEVV